MKSPRLFLADLHAHLENDGTTMQMVILMRKKREDRKERITMASKNTDNYETILTLAYVEGQRTWKAGPDNVTIAMEPMAVVNGPHNINVIIVTAVNNRYFLDHRKKIFGR
jgi:hypothetical protein